MRPDANEQFDGIAHVLDTCVVDQVDDVYALDILNGSIATLRMLAATLDEVGPFLLWDIDESRRLLSMVGVEVADPEIPPFDLAALRACHREVRGVLESSVEVIRSDDTASAAFIAHVQARAARYPFVSQYRGGSLARPSR